MEMPECRERLEQHPPRAAILLLHQITDDVLGQLRSE